MRAGPDSQPGGERAEAGTGEPPAAERGVERGQDRPSVQPLEREPLRVRRDIDRAEAGAEAEERNGEPAEATGERGEKERGGTPQQRDDRDTAAADAPAEPPGRGHRGQRTDRRGEEREPEPRVCQVRMSLHGRDPGRPRTDQEAVAEEEERDRDARAAHQASTISTPSAR